MTERIDHGEGRRLFGADPDGYDAARPHYPEELYRFLVDEGAIRPGTPTLEIGAGSGIATRRLLELGADPLTILEPDERFAPRLRAIAASTEARCEIVHAAFEDFEPQRSYSLIAAATSFHWVEPEIGREKLARLLEPEASAALWWNVLQDLDKPDPFHDATQHVLRNLAVSPLGGPGSIPYPLDRAAREMEFARMAAFAPARYMELRWTHVLNAEGVAKLYAGFSHIQRLDQAAQRRILNALFEIANEEFGGRVERNVTSVIYLLRRR